MLRVARRIGRELPVTVRTTFLGAHALPPEHAGRADAYIDEVCKAMLPALVNEGLVDAVDAFCETIGPVQPDRTRLSRGAGARDRSSCTPSNSPTSAVLNWSHAMAGCRRITSVAVAGRN
jgi:hypothetical protein